MYCEENREKISALTTSNKFLAMSSKTLDYGLQRKPLFNEITFIDWFYHNELITWIKTCLRVIVPSAKIPFSVCKLCNHCLNKEESIAFLQGGKSYLIHPKWNKHSNEQQRQKSYECLAPNWVNPSSFQIRIWFKLELEINILKTWLHLKLCYYNIISDQNYQMKIRNWPEIRMRDTGSSNDVKGFGLFTRQGDGVSEGRWLGRHFAAEDLLRRNPMESVGWYELLQRSGYSANRHSHFLKLERWRQQEEMNHVLSLFFLFWSMG